MASTAPLRTSVPSVVRTPLVRVSAAERDRPPRSSPASARSRRHRPRPPARRASPRRSRASSTMERPSGVSSRIDATSAAVSASDLGDAGRRRDRRREAVAVGDGAGLVEQDDVHVAGRLHGAAAHGQHVEARDAVHARDADGGEQPADGRRDEAHEERHELDGAHRSRPRTGRTAAGSRPPCRNTRVRPASRMAERDLVGRPLPLGALDERDHAVEERLARIGRDADDDAVADERRAAGDACCGCRCRAP